MNESCGVPRAVSSAVLRAYPGTESPFPIQRCTAETSFHTGDMMSSPTFHAGTATHCACAQIVERTTIVGTSEAHFRFRNRHMSLISALSLHSTRGHVSLVISSQNHHSIEGGSKHKVLRVAAPNVLLSFVVWSDVRSLRRHLPDYRHSLRGSLTAHTYPWYCNHAYPEGRYIYDGNFRHRIPLTGKVSYSGESSRYPTER